MRASLLLISMSLTLGSCSSPPKPPTVDESLKRPANSAVAVELQVCKSELQNTRILASETTRLADSASQYANDRATRLALQQQALAGRPAAAQHFLHLCVEVGRLHQPVRALADGDRPFGILAQGQARHADDARLLLHAARVGEQDLGAVHQREEIEVHALRTGGKRCLGLLASTTGNEEPPRGQRFFRPH